MRTKRNLFTFALGGAAGFIVGRYPAATYETLRDGAGATLGMARKRIGTMPLPFGHTGDHRARSAAPTEAVDDIERTSAAYVSRPHP
ncbi:hypothetical protein ACIA03_28920 [Nocardioides sp. NPDC051685]|uniref:hypothetical protein n=1 Tax=Nocardioides sp. NPDC051685 TaxID=3364334 RepID=UPI003789C1DB